MREGYSTACPRWALLGWSDALSGLMALTHCHPRLQQWQQSPVSDHPPPSECPSLSTKQEEKPTGCSRDCIHRAAQPSQGWAVLFCSPRLLPPSSGALWDAANWVNWPGFLNAAQHTHTLGEFLTSVSEQERWFISCAWPGNGPG